MIERTSERRIVIIGVKRRNADTLIPLILSHVHHNSAILTNAGENVQI
ncbi:hypothetical protein AAJ76_5200016548 [Vairimorpha ceranae]|uniref:Uncharacterized protein n=1 Tax=Vairimorpha ceranae TaxID=40302 RepID=A0A0F9WNT8_9MICR|nr:hypothetical protein AAJ76_5200016548 [Vairimorpha ceranae]KKO74668.1 hypothetical protein AAJ76_5200016548 [Vairimorpha ceranae]